MNNLQKLRKPFILRWVSSYSFCNNFKPSRINLCPAESHHHHIAQNLRLYGTGGAQVSETSDKQSHVSRSARKEAQVALLEYLYCTRSLQFTDAENMSKNSPRFLENLLRKVDSNSNGGIGRSLTRFLRYHPINEFEPFFESMGLKPSEYSSFLPRELMFLNDDPLLMENYHVLSNYGVPRNQIGKIYRVAPEIFGYGNAVLHSKFKSIEHAGLDQNTVIKLVISSPNVLVGDVRKDFFKILEKLKSIGIGQDWIERGLLKGDCCHWSSMLELLSIFGKVGCTEDQISGLIQQHPDLLLAGSGRFSISIVVFLMKFGYSPSEICAIFMQFPEIPVEKFLANLCNCYEFLCEIEMDVPDIQSIVCAHALLLGSCSIKRANSLLVNLAIGKKRMCKIVKENPTVLKNWVLGKKVKRLPIPEEERQSRMMKTKFLLDLGFVENSKEMNRAVKVFRGKGNELQERFDCIVAAGLDPKEVSDMVKLSPQILNQSKNVIETKISYLVNDVGCPISALRKFPSFLNYNVQRVNLRLSMYNWLKNMGAVDPDLALITLVASSETLFKKTYVNLHPEGPQIWDSLKQKIQDPV